MALSDFNDRTRLFLVRFKIERPGFPIFPRFRTTLILLWVIALGGAAYGHVWLKGDQGRSLAYLCTILSWAGAVLILLLRETSQRIRTLLGQIVAITVTMLFVITLPIAYSLFYYAQSPASSIKVVWGGGVIVLGLLSLWLVWRTLVKPRVLFETPYPGFRSAPLLFLVVAANYIWWQWPIFISWFR